MVQIKKLRYAGQNKGEINMAYKNLEMELDGKKYSIDIQNLVSTISKLEYALKNPSSAEQFTINALKCAKEIMMEIVTDPELWESGHWNDQSIEQVNFDDFYYDEDAGRGGEHG